ncbi:replication initiation and membrane attachment family protein [Oceanobacillus chungangensis]|uniref:Chromosome replication initiation protein n=1 Tax=Oceanobacillus chungangensis TaxID=1229152 RepID=A0A3D8Q1W8_9BACI|nr:DnaD domain protein [Oceanobacillus chungangensis]RDW21598.1 chromosome replication initiation protein [Oceanobacillus chungangensis]
MKYLGKVLPVDGYYVILQEYLPNDYTKSLAHLYQPLIGVHAVTLYQTLLHEMELQSDSTPQTHHTLMNYLNIPLDEVYKARLKLEGIGLLNTFKKQAEERTVFTYELLSPFAPSDFFKDAMLSQLLMHQIGDTKYHALKRHYYKEAPSGIGENITARFNEVFQTFTPSIEAVKPKEKVNKIQARNERSIDFSWMVQMLKQRLIPVGKVLTQENRKLISQMVLLYGLDSYEVEKSVLWALTEDNVLDTDEFKTACHDLFKSKHYDKSITLTEKRTPPEQQQTEPQTKEEMLIQELESISPKQLLEDLSGGNQASEQDLKAIREVMVSQGLPAPVMNVLVHYVLLQSNMKLSKAYLEKIASHWSRANIKTAKEAMEFAKTEQNKFQKGSKQKTAYNYKPISKEIIPDWFKDRNKTKQSTVAQTSQTVIDLEKEKAELQALLNGKAIPHKNRSQG